MMIKVTPTVSFMRSRLSSMLYELASRHGGYFTTREAAQAGLSSRQLSYHASSGELERVAHGVYRLVNYPEHAHGDMIVAGNNAVERAVKPYEQDGELERFLAAIELVGALPHA